MQSPLFFDMKRFVERLPALAWLDDQSVFVLGEGLPLVGEQLPEAGDRMRHDAAEYIIEVLPRIDATGLAGLDQAEE